MTRILYRRDSMLMRLISASLAVVFTLSLAGSGIAAPASSGTTEAASAEQFAPEQPPEPQAEKPTEPEAPAADAKKAPADEPPAEEPAPAAEAPADATADGVSPDAGDGAADKKDAPTLSAAVAGDVSIVEFMGYNEDKANWTSGNLGSYSEGEYVPYRLVLKNTGDTTLTVGQMAFGLDHYNGNPKPAVMFDWTRNWGYALATSAPSVGDGPGAPAGFQSLTPSSQDVLEGGSASTAPTIRTTIGSGAFGIPPNQFAIVYFTGHLALTAWWQANYGIDGAGGYPGSSGHGYLQMATGARTLPLPSVAIPSGSIKVIKFYDTNHDGQKSANETQTLSGWTMNLSNSSLGVDVSDVTDANGEAFFDWLLPGTYTLTENLQAGWSSNTGAQAVTVTGNEEKTVYVGNFRPDVTKTFSLNMDTLPAGGTPVVKFTANAASQEMTLTGSGPYSASKTYSYGTVIGAVSWYVRYNGTDVLLGTSSGETLMGSKTNSFTYNSLLSGSKYSDVNGNGDRDTGEVGLQDWQIVLVRVVGSTETTYAEAMTVSDGTYSFADVIPGTYKVYEVNKSGWYNTEKPARTVTVVNASNVTGLDFGNLRVATAIDLTKSGPSAVHVGDTVTYQFGVQNTGNFPLSDVVVSDPTLGLNHYVGTLAVGRTVSFAATITAAAAPDPIVNQATALGYSVFGNVSDIDDHVVDVISPAIDLTKVADRTMLAGPGSVTYTYVVRNTGDTTLTGVALTDDQFTVPGGSIGTLAPSEVVTLTYTTTISETTTNVADVEGFDTLQERVTDTATEVVTVTSPSIGLVKTATPGTVFLGDDVTYTYLVTNTGDVPLSSIDVTDDILGYIGTVAFLAPGASDSLTTLSSVSEDTTNVGTAVGDYGVPGTDYSGSVTATDDAFVDLVGPGIQVVKSAVPDVIHSGDTVEYRYVVTNTGDIALHDISVTDDILGAIGTIASLAPSASTTLTTNTLVVQDTENLVVALGEYGEVGSEFFGTVEDTDIAFVDVISPAIDLTKVADRTMLAGPGSVTYTYVVRNIGDTTLTGVALTDDQFTVPGGSIGTLAPSEVVTLTYTTTISETTTNVADVEGFDTLQERVTDTATEVVTVTSPAVRIVKTASPVTLSGSGTVDYTFVVTNIGDMPLTSIDVVDDHLGYIGTIAFLGVGQSATLTDSALIAADTTNVATATAEYGVPGTDFYGEVFDDDDAIVDVVGPAITVVKEAVPGTVHAGDDVTYTYLVTNTGDVTLTSIDVSDDILGAIGTIASLAPGASSTLSTVSAVALDTTNIGTAEGEFGVPGSEFYGTVVDRDTAFVDVVSPAIDLTKVADRTMLAGPGSVTYTYVVRNTGDTTLTGVALTDDQFTVPGGSIGTLAPSEVVTLTYTTTISETTTNVADVEGFDTLQERVTDTATEVVTVTSPGIEIVKTASPDTVLAGEVVTYTFVVRNTGDVPLAPVVVSDDIIGAIGTVPLLPVGGVTTLTATAAVSVDTTNVATATGQYGVPETPYFGTVTDTDDAFVNVVSPAIDVEKSASEEAVPVGGSVLYTYTVRNTGDVGLFDVLLVDDQIGTVGTLASLAVGASAEFQATDTLSEPTTNTVVATGRDASEHEVRDEATAFVDVFVPFTPPDVAIEKSASESLISPGDQVVYTITYRNIGEGAATDFTITDDFDERYVTVIDANGGVVENGRITWTIPGPLYAEDGPQTIQYRVEVDADLPESVTRIDNTVVADVPGDENLENNRDSASVEVEQFAPFTEEEERFLPFTGMEALVLVIVALMAALVGVMLRRLGKAGGR